MNALATLGIQGPCEFDVELRSLNGDMTKQWKQKAPGLFVQLHTMLYMFGERLAASKLDHCKTRLYVRRWLGWRIFCVIIFIYFLEYTYFVMLM